MPYIYWTEGNIPRTQLTFLEDLTPNHQRSTHSILTSLFGKYLLSIGIIYQMWGTIRKQHTPQQPTARINPDQRKQNMEIESWLVKMRSLYILIFGLWSNPHTSGSIILYKQPTRGPSKTLPTWSCCSAHILGSQTCCTLSIALLFGFFEDLKTNDFTEKGVFLKECNLVFNTHWVTSPHTHSLKLRLKNDQFINMNRILCPLLVDWGKPKYS